MTDRTKETRIIVPNLQGSHLEHILEYLTALDYDDLKVDSGDSSRGSLVPSIRDITSPEQFLIKEHFREVLSPNRHGKIKALGARCFSIATAPRAYGYTHFRTKDPASVGLIVVDRMTLEVIQANQLRNEAVERAVQAGSYLGFVARVNAGTYDFRLNGLGPVVKAGLNDVAHVIRPQIEAFSSN